MRQQFCVQATCGRASAPLQRHSSYLMPTSYNRSCEVVGFQQRYPPASAVLVGMWRLLLLTLHHPPLNSPSIELSFPGGSEGKESVRNAGNPASIPGLGRSPGEGMTPWTAEHQASLSITNSRSLLKLMPIVKNPPANAGDLRDMGWIPGSARSPGGGHGNPL